MPYYMFTGRYSLSSIKAMVDKPQDREAGARTVVEAAGGRLHSFFFMLGSDDLVAIVEAPDDEAMVAASMAIGASGSLSSGATTRLLTAEEAMGAMHKAKAALAGYRPPAA